MNGGNGASGGGVGAVDGEGRAFCVAYGNVNMALRSIVKHGIMMSYHTGYQVCGPYICYISSLFLYRMALYDHRATYIFFTLRAHEC